MGTSSNDFTTLNNTYNMIDIEQECDIIHRLALESNEPAIIDALNTLHILVKLYHADDIAEEHDENRKISLSMKNKLDKLVKQSSSK